MPLPARLVWLTTLCRASPTRLVWQRQKTDARDMETYRDSWYKVLAVHAKLIS